MTQERDGLDIQEFQRLLRQGQREAQQPTRAEVALAPETFPLVAPTAPLPAAQPTGLNRLLSGVGQAQRVEAAEAQAGVQAGLDGLGWLFGKLEDYFQFFDPERELVSGAVIEPIARFGAALSRDVPQDTDSFLQEHRYGELTLPKVKKRVLETFQKSGLGPAYQEMRRLMGERRRARKVTDAELFPMEFFIEDVALDPLTPVGFGLLGKVPVAGRVLGPAERAYIDATNGVIDLALAPIRALPKGQRARRAALVREVEEHFRVAMGDAYLRNDPADTERFLNDSLLSFMQGRPQEAQLLRQRPDLARLVGVSMGESEAVTLGVIKAIADESPQGFWRFMEAQLRKRPQEAVADFARRYVSLTERARSQATEAARRAGQRGAIAQAWQTAQDLTAGLVPRRLRAAVPATYRFTNQMTLVSPSYAPWNAAESGFRMLAEGVTPGMLAAEEYRGLMSGFKNIPSEFFAEAGRLGEAQRMGLALEAPDLERFNLYERLAQIYRGKVPQDLRDAVRQTWDAVGFTPEVIATSGRWESALKRHFHLTKTTQNLDVLLEREARRNPAVARLLEEIDGFAKEFRSDVGVGLKTRLRLAAAGGTDGFATARAAMSTARMRRKDMAAVISATQADLGPGTRWLFYDWARNGLAEELPAVATRALQREIADFEAQVPRTLAVSRMALDWLEESLRAGRTDEVAKLRQEALMLYADLNDLPRQLTNKNAAKARAQKRVDARTAIWEQHDKEMAELTVGIDERAERLLGLLEEINRRQVLTPEEANAVIRFIDETRKLTRQTWDKDRAFVSDLNAKLAAGEIERSEFFLLLRDGRESIWEGASKGKEEVLGQYFKRLEPQADARHLLQAARDAQGDTVLAGKLEAISKLSDDLEQLVRVADPTAEASMAHAIDGAEAAWRSLPPGAAERLKELGQKAVDDTLHTYRNTFTNYDNANGFDDAATRVFPFWMYGTRLLGYLARLGATHPGVAMTFMLRDGKFWKQYPEGKAPISPSLAVNPLAGTGFLRLRRLGRELYPAREIGLSAIPEQVGRFTHNLLHPSAAYGIGAAVIDQLSGRDTSIGEELPGIGQALIHLTGSIAPGIETALFPWLTGDFKERAFRLELLEATGKGVGDFPPDAPQIEAARRAANLKSLWTDIFTNLRYLYPARDQVRAQVNALTEEALGLPAGTMERLRLEGKSLATLGIDIPPLVRDQLEKIESYAALVELSEPLRRSDIRLAQATISQAWKRVDELRALAYERQLILDWQLDQGIISSDDWGSERRRIGEETAIAVNEALAGTRVPVSVEMLRNLPEEERAWMLSDAEGHFLKGVPLAEEEKRIFSALTGYPIPTLDPLRDLLNRWWDIRPEKHLRPDGTVDWPTYMRARATFLDLLPQEPVTLPAISLPELGIEGKPVQRDLKREFLEYLKRNDSPQEAAWRNGSITYMRPWYDTREGVATWIERIVGSKEEAEQYRGLEETERRLRVQASQAFLDGRLTEAENLRRRADVLENYRNRRITLYRRYLVGAMSAEERQQVARWLRMFDQTDYRNYFTTAGGR